MQIIAGAELRLVFPLSKSDFLFARMGSVNNRGGLGARKS